MIDVHPDIVYRVFRKESWEEWEWLSKGKSTKFITNWYMNNLSVCGIRGCFNSIDRAKASASRSAKRGYEIWKFHVGTPNSEVPYFYPKKVFEK